MMSDFDDPFATQVPFGSDNFAENPEPRCPCVLVLDRSGSMVGRRIEELNAGLQTFRDELISDSLASKRVEVAIVTFGPPVVEQSFHTVANFNPPTLTAESDTPMGAALNQAIDLVESRKAEYRSNGISFYRPWVFLITDGAPTDDWRSAAARVREGEASKKYALFSVGVEGADFDVLRQIAVREPLKLEGLKFRELFQWLSNSMKAVSQSTPGTKVKLESPAGWAQV
jgi:uncharacterized protein YegL